MILFWAVAREFFVSLASTPPICSISLLSKFSGVEGSNEVCLTLMCYKGIGDLSEDGLDTCGNASELQLKIDWPIKSRINYW